MRLPFTKKRRGPAKNPAVRAKDQEAKLNEFLARMYLKDLREHPSYARQIARERFSRPESIEGYPSPGNDHMVEAEPPDILEVLRQAKEAKSLIRDELKEGKSGVWSGVAELMRSFPEFVTGLKGLGVQIGPPQASTRWQIEQPPPAPPAPAVQEEVPQAPTREESILMFADKILGMEPGEVALELFENRDTDGDIRAVLYRLLTSMDYDTLVSLLPAVESDPNYLFLAPVVAKMDLGWLALVKDEIDRLSSEQI